MTMTKLKLLLLHACDDLRANDSRHPPFKFHGHGQRFAFALAGRSFRNDGVACAFLSAVDATASGAAMRGALLGLVHPEGSEDRPCPIRGNRA